MSEDGTQSNEAKSPSLYAQARDLFGKMPLLAHWPDRSKPFDPLESDVCGWLMETMDERMVRGILFDYARSNYFITYDKESGKWRGNTAADREAWKETKKRAAEEKRLARMKAAAEHKANKAANRKKPGRQKQFSDTLVVDLLETYQAEHNGARPTSPELWAWASKGNYCNRPTYFRRLKFARAAGLVDDVRTKRADGGWVMELRAVMNKPAPVILSMDSDIL